MKPQNSGTRHGPASNSAAASECRIFYVTGMSCAACAARVERAARTVPGVSQAEVSLLHGTLAVRAGSPDAPDMTGRHDRADRLEASLREALEAAGYGLKSSGGAAIADPDERTQLKALWLSLALALTVMALAMGSHMGLFAAAPVLNWSQALLTALVMWLQRGFFISAGKSLRGGGANMDVLVSLGSIASYGYSLTALLAGGGHGGDLHDTHGAGLYFESAAAVLAFVAVGRFLEGRLRRRTGAALEDLSAMMPAQVRLIAADGITEVMTDLDAVKPGDKVALKAGDRTGTDAVIREGQAVFNESALTGESRPVTRGTGENVLSGALVTAGSCIAEVTAVGGESTMGRIVTLVREASARKGPGAALTDRLAAVFVPAVVVIAVITFGIWYLCGAGAAQALDFAVSVLVVSCPCALGLATPAAMTAAIGRAARAGIVFKSPEDLENLARAQVFAFDKTGTLTRGEMRVCGQWHADPGLMTLNLTLAAAVERHSAHPLAQAVQSAAAGLKLPCTTEFKAEPGLGVSAVLGGERLWLGNEKLVQRVLQASGTQLAQAAQDFARQAGAQGQSVIWFVRKDQVVCAFAVGDSLRPGAAETVKALMAAGAQVMMLTGDGPEAAQACAAETGIKDVRSSMLPEDKASAVRSAGTGGRMVAMLGDGVNDSLPLAEAGVGIGMQGASDLALSSCGVVLMSGQPGDILRARCVAAAGLRAVRQNLLWAFVYNTLFIPVAAGVLYPLLQLRLTPAAAAVLMSLSSVCVMLNALRLTVLRLPDLRPGTTAADGSAGAGADDKNHIPDVPDGDGEEENRKMQDVRIGIRGMHCEHCVSAVKKQLEALPGVTKVDVSLDQACAVVGADGTLDRSLLKLAVENAGFEVTDVA